MTWPKVKLGDVCERVSTLNPTRDLQSETFQYIDIASVSRETKQIETSSTLLLADAPSRARQSVNENDILISTVRPNLNAVAKISAQLDGAVASTGFTVLRSNQKLLCENWLFQWVKSPSFVDDMTDKAAGASYPAVSDRIVKDSEIPLPPIAEQKRLASILDAADALRQQRRETLRVLDELAQSLFLELFGDPATNPKGWEVVKLGDVTQINPRMTKQLSSDQVVSFVPMACVLEEGRLEREEMRIYSQVKTGFTPFLRNDILFAKITPCFENGKIAVATISNDCGFGSTEFHVVRKDTEKTDTIFLLHFLRQKRIRTEGERKMTGSAGQRRVPKHFLETFEIPLPPLALQQQFAAQIEELEAIKRRARESSTRLDALFACLQARAFAGELSDAD